MAGSEFKLQSNKSLIFGHLGALLCVSMWGVSFVSTKVLLNAEMQPVEIYIYRFALAYLIILALKHKRWFANKRRDEGYCAFAAYWRARFISLRRISRCATPWFQMYRCSHRYLR